MNRNRLHHKQASTALAMILVCGSLSGIAHAEPTTPESLAYLRRQILSAQPSDGIVRVPLSAQRLKNVQQGLVRRGVHMSMVEIRPASDLATAYLRENTTKKAFANKVRKGISHRPGFHGNTAEFAEARLRSMHLTKDIQSRTWDLTQPKSRPWNAQVKVYKNSIAAIRSAVDDVRPITRHLKPGHRATILVPSRTIDDGIRSGLLRRHNGGFSFVDDSKIAFQRLKSFSTASKSAAYATRGQDALARMAKQPRTSVVIARGADSARLLTKIGPAALAGAGTAFVEGGFALADLNTGKINKSDFALRIQDATAKAAAVGTAIHVVYLIAATPHGFVVVGAGIVAYAAADMLTTHIRSELNGQYVTVSDLHGIAPARFLDNLNSNLAVLNN